MEIPKLEKEDVVLDKDDVVLDKGAPSKTEKEFDMKINFKMTKVMRV